VGFAPDVAFSVDFDCEDELACPKGEVHLYHYLWIKRTLGVEWVFEIEVSLR
jgi:hypothetical protein